MITSNKTRVFRLASKKTTLEHRAHGRFFSPAKGPHDCKTNTQDCGAIDSDKCSYNCPFAKKQNQIEQDTRASYDSRRPR